MRYKSGIQNPAGDRIFIFGIYLFLSVITILVFYPLLYILSSSFSSPEAVVSGRVWLWPVEPTFMGYEAVFSHPQVMTGFANSLFYTLVGSAINVALTVMIGYPLSKVTFYGRNAITAILIFTMLFSGGLIPLYLTVKSLGILDTRWAMILPTGLSVFQAIIARTFFQMTIPKELSEAAELDGSSDIGFMARIVIPLSKPIIAVLFLMYAVGHWNAYFDALIYLKSPDLYPLQIVLRNILILNQIDLSMVIDVEEMMKRQYLKDLLKYSLIVVAITPILVLYPFVQRFFIKGVMIGSLKG